MHASVSYALFCNCQQGIRHLGNGREVCPRNVHVNLRVMALRSPPRFSLQSRPQNGWQDLSKHKSPCVDHGRCMFSCEGTLISSAPLALLFRDQGTEVQITQPTKALKVSSIGQDAEVTSSNLDQIMLDPPPGLGSDAIMRFNQPQVFNNVFCVGILELCAHSGSMSFVPYICIYITRAVFTNCSTTALLSTPPPSPRATPANDQLCLTMLQIVRGRSATASRPRGI